MLPRFYSNYLFVKYSGFLVLHKVLKTHLLLFGLLLALAGFYTSAMANLDKADRAEMHRVIKQYIMDNPEVLRDALMELAAREKQAFITAGLAKLSVMMVTPLWAMLKVVWLSMSFLIITAAIAKECSQPFSNC